MADRLIAIDTDQAPGEQLPDDVRDEINALLAPDFDAKLDVPAGTPDGSKFLRDDNTWADPPAGGVVDAIVAGSNIDVDATDPTNPIVSVEALTADDITDGTINHVFTAADDTKLTGIEALADVTDAANVTAAGAIMDGDFTTNGLMKRTGAGVYATAASGTDYAPATSGSSALKGNGAGGFANATLNDVGQPTADFSMNSRKFTNALDPTNAQDVATKAYVDALVQGQDVKASAVAATTGTETFTIAAGSVTQINGTAIDGVSPAINDRILIKDAPAATGVGSVNSTQPGNGIYRVTGNTTNLTVTRATDQSGANNPQGDFVFVEGGTANGSNGFTVTVPNTTGSFTWGTNNIKWTQFSGAGQIIAGTGLSKSGNTLNLATPVSVANGGTGAGSLTGLIKGTGTTAFTAAAAGTDYYAPASTDVAVADGGTGASTAAAARTNLGLVIGTDVQAPLSPTAVKTANYTAAAGELVPVDTTSGILSATLPTTPADKSIVAVTKVDASANYVIVARGGSAKFYSSAGPTSGITLSAQGDSVVAQYNAAGDFWHVLSKPKSFVQVPVWYEVHAGYATRVTGYQDNSMGLLSPDAWTLTEIVYRGATADASGSTTCEVRQNGTQITGSSKAVAAANQWAYGANVRVTGLSIAIAAGDILRPYLSAIGTTPGAGFSAVLIGRKDVIIP